MAKVEASVVIGKPVEEVFAYVMDVGNWPKWNAYLPSVEQTSEGPVGVGTTFRGSSQFLGRSMEWTSEVTGYEENSKMAQVITSGPMSMQQTMLFEAVEGGTKFTMAGEGEFGGFFKLAEGMVNRRWRSQADESLGNLKKMLEAAG
jgi:uncharacterized membrane protein